MDEKKIFRCLWGFRITFLIIFMFIIYWSSSALELDQLITYSIPLGYQSLELYYQPQKIFVVFLPFLFNIALWRQNFITYVFIRSVIFIEACRIFVAVIINGWIIVYCILGFSEHVKFVAALSSFSYFGFLIYMNKIFRKPEWRRIYYEKSESTPTAIKKAMAVVLAVYILLFVLHLIEENDQNKQFAATENIVKYYALGQPNEKEYAGYRHRLRMSSTGEFFSNVYEEKSYAGNVGIFDIKTGELIKNINIGDITYSIISKNGKSVFAVKRFTETINDPEGRGVFEEWSIISGNKIRDFYATDAMLKRDMGQGYYIREISFSEHGTYVSAEGRGVAIWDHRSGELIAYYNDDIKRKQLLWMSDTMYMVMEMGNYTDDYGNQRIHVGEVSTNKQFIKTKKENMTVDLLKKTKDLSKMKGYIKKGIDKNIVAVVIGGIPENGVLRQKIYFDIWDVENEKKIFSLENPYEILGVLFYPDGEHVLLLEEMYGEKRRISVWNIKKNIKEKSYYFLDSGDIINMALIEDGDYLAQLKHPITIMNMK